MKPGESTCNSVVERADKVTLLASDPIEPPDIQPAEVVARLRWHGVTPEVVRFDVHEEEIGAAYLKHAAEVGADMLVKGAYARNRLRQMILGGRTRHIISHTRIPVFLCN